MQDLSGKKFNNLKVLFDPMRSDKKCKCLCDCGKECFVSRYHLLDGHTKSCGCRHKKYVITNKRIFNIWSGMMDRCKFPNRRDANNYFLKGIRVCDEWQVYDPFEAWALANGYEDNLTIDRIDGNGNYSPENCRWISIQEQQKNKETTTFYSCNGETMCLTDWAKKTGINRMTLWNRIHDEGMTMEEAINKKFRSQKTNIHLFVDGEETTVLEVANKYGIKASTIYKYLSQGKTIDSIIEHFTTQGV